MYPIDFIIGCERYKEMLREAEQERLIWAIRSQQSNNGGGPRQVANWIGTQMVKWGAKLQRYGSAPLPEVSSLEAVG